MTSDQSSSADTPVFKWLVMAWLLFAVVLYVRFPPFWSLMDDASNLSLVEHWHTLPFGTGIKEYIERDLQYWGMYRPLYPVYIAVFYNVFQNSPAFGYSLVALFIVLLFAAWTMVFRRTTRSAPALSWLYLLLLFVFTPHFNLLQHASLQEKFILLSGLALFFLIDYLDRRPSPLSWGTWGAAALFVIVSAGVGILGKATAVFLAVPLAVGLSLNAIETRDAKRWGLVVLACATYLLSAGYFMSIRSSYSSGYSLHDLPSKLMHPSARMLLFTLLGLAGLGTVCTPRDRQPRWSWRLPKAGEVIWPLGLLAFLAVMVPWTAGISSYYVIPAGVFAVGTVVLCLERFWALTWARYAAVAGSVVLMFVSGTILAQRLRTQSGTRLLVHWLQNERRSQATFWMPTPCYEASGSLTAFSGTPVKVAKDDRIDAGQEAGPIYLLTRRDCPRRPIDGFSYGDRVLKDGEWELFVDRPQAP